MVNKFCSYRLLLVLLISIQPFACAKPFTVDIPMSDGVILKAELWRPAPFGSFPVLLERTPYNRKEIIKNYKDLVKSGYAVLVQNVRGTRDSEGQWEVFGHDSWGEVGRRDGLDTVEWLKAQKWCNGKIGLIGFSASAITGKLLLASQPQGIACAYLVAGSDNMYETVFPQGCYRKNTIEEWGPAREFLPEIIKHPSYDAFWEIRNARSRAYLVNVPVYIVGGWFDLFQRSSTEFFNRVQNNGYIETKKSKLVIHPLSHAGPPGELKLEDRHKINLDTQFGSMLDWFDFWLRDKPNGIDQKPNVALFIMADPQNPGEIGNTYHFYDAVPWSNDYLILYLHPNGELSTEIPNTTGAFSEYIYDPQDPTPSKGGNNLTPPAGPYDQREIKQRSDLLVFTSPPVAKHLLIIGTILVQLYASTDAQDTDFGARFCDVYPDGRSMLMNEGMVRARYRNSISKEELVQPNQVYEFKIDLWDTALYLAPKHRIRLTVISASNPRYEPNPNTGEPFRQHTSTVKAKNRVFHNPQYPSRLLLPVMKMENYPIIFDSHNKGKN